jgi:hypothetical protein
VVEAVSLATAVGEVSIVGGAALSPESHAAVTTPATATAVMTKATCEILISQFSALHVQSRRGAE